MKAKNLMTSPVISVQRHSIIPEIARTLLERRISGVPVVDDENRAIGIVSEADLMERLATDRLSGSWFARLFRIPERSAVTFIKTHGSRAEDIMTAPVVSVDEETPIDEVATLLKGRNIKRLLVTSNGRLTGIICRSDLLIGLTGEGVVASPSNDSSDEEISARLAISLKNEPWAHAPYSFYSVENGTVHLWGMVDATTQIKAFQLAAEETPGVKSVINHLSLTSPYIYYGE